MIEKDDICPNESDRIVGWAPYASIVFTTLGGVAIGAAKGGAKNAIAGGVFGFSAGVIDEILMVKSISNKHYLSSSVFWQQVVLAPYISSITSPIKYISYVASFGVSYIVDDFLNFTHKIDAPMNAFLRLLVQMLLK
jgi:hypothetical protein